MTDAEATHDLLRNARARWSQARLASLLGVDVRTIKRWQARECAPPAYASLALQQLLLPPSRPDLASGGDFTFIDLFAGIGGIRLGFEATGGRCVFTSEWDEYSLRTYRANFTDDHPIVGDITKVNAADIPDHDVLLAGFPCQPFSLAGVSKKNSLGKEHGFRCETQGTLFFDVARIIDVKRPKAFLLENVKNLVSHDKGKTFDVILRTLTDDLGYTVFTKVIDGAHWVPQHRERILIAGFREPVGFSWDDLRYPNAERPILASILHPEDGSEEPEVPFTQSTGLVAEKYTLSTKLWGYLKAYAKKHRAKGNGFGYSLVGPDDVARTLSARYHKDGSEILVSRGGRRNPRRLTPRECARLMGFDRGDRKIEIPVSDTRAYRQFGNSVVVPVMEEAARIMKPHLMAITEFEKTGALQLPLNAS